jgi:hypothetical protein
MYIVLFVPAEQVQLPSVWAYGKWRIWSALGYIDVS